MLNRSTRKPHNTLPEEADDFDPAHLPVEPDEGPVPANIPSDPEGNRIADPGG